MIGAPRSDVNAKGASIIAPRAKVLGKMGADVDHTRAIVGIEHVILAHYARGRRICPWMSLQVFAPLLR